MADNFTFTPGTGASGAADEIGGILYPRVKLTWGADGTANDASDAAPLPAVVGGRTTNPAATQFARPGDTTAYASGDLVANSVTAGSVTPLQFTVPRVAAGSFLLVGCRLKKSTAVITLAAFRLHLYHTIPTIATTGDNGVFASVVSGAASHIGAFDIAAMLAHADGAVGYGAPDVGSMRGIKLASGSTVYALLEARGAYAPGNAETFDAYLEVLQD